MTDHELKVPADERLDPTVERAATLLRRPEPVRQAWRDELLSRVSTPPRARRIPVRVWIPIGIAAAVCAAVGVERHAAGAVGDRVRFSVSAPSAKRVSLVGDVWVVDVRLEPGRHVFAFSVDGALRADAAAPRAVEDDFGVPGSVVVVPGRGSD
jgi:hypothetical protein